MVVVKVLSEIRRFVARLRQLFASMRQRRGVWLFSREFPLQDDDTAAAARPSASSPLRARLRISDLSAAGPCPKRKPQLETLLTTYCSTGCNANCMHCPLVYSWEPGWTCPGGLETAPKDVENQCVSSLRSSCHYGQQRANPRIARGSNFLYFLIVKRETSSVVFGDWSRGIIGRHWLH